MPPMAKRFLPTQEWSAGGREYVGRFLPIVAGTTLLDSCFRRNGPGEDGGVSPKIRPIVARTIAKIAPDSHSPTDHSCEGRNLKGQRPSPPHLADTTL